jgi:hypothetical protein
VLRDGPVPLVLHGIIEYLAAVLFIAAPFLFGFDSGRATAVAVVVGVAILVVAACTAGPTGLVRQLSITAHVVLDYVLAAFLIATPFVFSFSDEGAPTAFFLVLGVAHLLITIGTRFLPTQHGGRMQAGEPS